MLKQVYSNPYKQGGYFKYHQIFNSRKVLRSAHTAVFMCSVWIWERTAIISLYSIKWLVFVPQTKCVYCAVRTGSLNIIRWILIFKFYRGNKCQVLLMPLVFLHSVTPYGRMLYVSFMILAQSKTPCQVECNNLRVTAQTWLHRNDQASLLKP
jgi:F0F1-type ATP synthase assembly protein I